LTPSRSKVDMSRCLCQLCRFSFSQIDITLNFTKRDGRLGPRAIIMEHRNPAVLTTLIDQTIRSLVLLFNESISVKVAVLIYPVYRTFNIFPQLLYGSKISRSFEVFPSDNYKQRSRINRAIVLSERNFIEVHHFTSPCFMQDFSRLGVR